MILVSEERKAMYVSPVTFKNILQGLRFSVGGGMPAVSKGVSMVIITVRYFVDD